MYSKSIFWHRRDLRIHDNAGLYKALKSSRGVQPIFIFDSQILQFLPKNDQRLVYIHQEIEQLKKKYSELGSDLKVYFGNPRDLIPEIVLKYKAEAVFINRDYEPYATERDRYLAEKLNELEVKLIGTKDHVLFEKAEITKDDGKPYTVFTPYSRKWKSNLNEHHLTSFPSENYTDNLARISEVSELISLQDMGFETIQRVEIPSKSWKKELIQKYSLNRDFPSLNGTSKLGLHLRFGSISIRELAREALQLNETFLNELIWRDFYQMIIHWFPHSAKNSFKTQYDRIRWENNEAHFQAWCNGKTGYPIVDAGMRELNATGFMHNRVRMIVASFLTKHLLIDWRLGEAYFAEKLLDFELASNTGGWQWAAGCGCDAAPYFRVFNPTTQQEKFDKKFEYIKKWVPEFETDNYPKPIIDHKFARERVLARYKEALDMSVE
jgi:deoxyribodipyrimidine photo-lyase